ncbi:MAG: VanZ family protein [bacterium]|nr:VanZ family protein [bacterium]
MKHYGRYLPLILWTGVIVWGSSRSSVSVTEARDLDILIHKLAHIVEYAILYLVFVYAFFSNKRTYPQLAIFALLFVFLFGVSDELHQSLTPTRSPRISDAFVDVTGGIVGYLIAKIYLKKKE